MLWKLEITPWLDEALGLNADTILARSREVDFDAGLLDYNCGSKPDYYFPPLPCLLNTNGS